MKSVNAVRLLRDGFKKIKGLFAQAESAEMRAPEMRAGVIKELRMILEVQGQIEDKIFYPALQEVPNAALAVAQGREELKAIRQSDDSLDDLIDLVFAHIETSETLLFPLADTLPESELETLGQEMSEYEMERMSEPQYDDAQPSVVQNPSGGEQKRKAI